MMMLLSVASGCATSFNTLLTRRRLFGVFTFFERGARTHNATPLHVCFWLGGAFLVRIECPAWCSGGH